MPPDEDPPEARARPDAGGAAPSRSERGPSPRTGDFPAGSSSTPSVEEAKLHYKTPHDIQRQAAQMEKLRAIMGVIVGGIAILAGLIVVLLGFSGTVQWEFEGLGVSSKVQTSAVGVVFAIVGLLVIVFTKPKFHVTGDSGRRK